MHTYTVSSLLLLSVLGISGASTETTPRSAQRVTTRPAQALPKGGPPASMPAEAKDVMDRFVKALRENQRDKALSYCSPRTRSRASQYGSEEYFQSFVPIARLQAEPEYRFWTYSRDPVAGEYFYFGCFLNLSRTPDGYPVDWQWWLEKTAHGWSIDLPDVPIDRWTQEEIDRQRRLKQKSDARWKALEPKLEGLRTRLTALTSESRLGEPLLLRLELINAGQHELSYDSQQVAVNGSMEITDEKGQRVDYVAGPVQTGGSFKPINAGETVILFDSLDIAKQYDLSKQGKYRLRFSGGGLEIGDPSSQSVARRRFPSNQIEIEVMPRKF